MRIAIFKNINASWLNYSMVPYLAAQSEVANDNELKIRASLDLLSLRVA
jgi:hypothetical protein